jgi:hypothetical protein
VVIRSVRQPAVLIPSPFSYPLSLREQRAELATAREQRAELATARERAGVRANSKRLHSPKFSGRTAGPPVPTHPNTHSQSSPPLVGSMIPIRPSTSPHPPVRPERLRRPRNQRRCGSRR